jgi:hypothetical protein
MFFVLQPGDSNNPKLLETFIQIIDGAACNDIYNGAYYGAFTDRMLCAGTSGFKGPCDVRSL